VQRGILDQAGHGALSHTSIASGQLQGVLINDGLPVDLNLFDYIDLQLGIEPDDLWPQHPDI
jgi:hypothetical protein